MNGLRIGVPGVLPPPGGGEPPGGGWCGGGVDPPGEVSGGVVPGEGVAGAPLGVVALLLGVVAPAGLGGLVDVSMPDRAAAFSASRWR